MPRLLSWVFLLSGLGSLGAQVAWAKLFAIGLGHEVPSVISVVTTVMVGLALGSAAWTFKPSGWSALRTYAWLELIIGLGVMLSAMLVLPWCRVVAGWMGVDPSGSLQWSLSILAPLVLLLPATAAMGATLPAMEALSGAPTPARSRGHRLGVCVQHLRSLPGLFDRRVCDHARAWLMVVPGLRLVEPGLCGCRCLAKSGAGVRQTGFSGLYRQSAPGYRRGGGARRPGCSSPCF